MVSVLASSVVDRGLEPQSKEVNFQWDDDEVRFFLDQHAELDCYGASSLKQQSAGKHVAPLGHIIIMFW
jgi:Cft2 family RNA processing exonuclease